jgi:hypothetical protein
VTLLQVYLAHEVLWLLRATFAGGGKVANGHWERPCGHIALLHEQSKDTALASVVDLTVVQHVGAQVDHNKRLSRKCE